MRYSNFSAISRRLCGVALAAAGLAGCVSVQPNSEQASYEQAIADAAVASPQKIRKLLPLPPGDMIDVVSWVTEKRLPCAASSPPCELQVGPDRMWVTLAGEVQ